MRTHIEQTMAGLAEDLARLSFLLARDAASSDIASIGLDIVDRLTAERAWLRDQPLSSLADDGARDVLSRYRIMVTRALLLGERFILTLDPDDRTVWVDCIVELGGVLDDRDAIPE